MLSRRLLRVKVLQALYAYKLSGNSEPLKGEKELLRSVDKLYDLYLLMLLIPVELAHVAGIKIEEAKNKHFPTQKDLNPSFRFADNRVIKLLKSDVGYNNLIKKNHISWSKDYEIIENLFIRIKKSTEYEMYLNSANDDIESDIIFIKNIYKQFVKKDGRLNDSIQEMSIYWANDMELAINLAVKTVVETEKGEMILIPKYKAEEDKDFIRCLYRNAIDHYQEYYQNIADKTKNWEPERIALTDMMLMILAVTELIFMPEIPVKVTLNEYIEIAKYFSTPNSKVFINGILDKLVAEFRRNDLIHKSGKGLLE